MSVVNQGKVVQRIRRVGNRIVVGFNHEPKPVPPYTLESHYDWEMRFAFLPVRGLSEEEICRIVTTVDPGRAAFFYADLQHPRGYEAAGRPFEASNGVAIPRKPKGLEKVGLSIKRFINGKR